MGFAEFLASNNKLGEMKNEAKRGFRIGQHLDNTGVALTLGSAIGKAAGMNTAGIDAANSKVAQAKERKDNIQRAIRDAQG
jgi:hypothetical protein